MVINEATRQFILAHREQKWSELAFLGNRFPEVDFPLALEQIQGWQTACKKLPSWAASTYIVYPPHLSMEQCSSEQTALYKANLLGQWMDTYGAKSSILYDFTGGFGVDFSFLARSFERSVYVERQEHLCDIVRHNLTVLGLKTAEVVCRDGVEQLHELPLRYALAGERHPVGGDAMGGQPSAAAGAGSVVFYLDPARRDGHGKKVFGLHDCQPDVALLRDELLQKSDAVLIKLSPMFDWHAAVAEMTAGGQGTGCEVHIVSVGNECKELLLWLTHAPTPLRVVCVNDAQEFSYLPQTPSRAAVSLPNDAVGRFLGWGTGGDSSDRPWYLYVPNASVMKSGAFDEVAARFGIAMLDSQSHLFVSQTQVDDFPGRRFTVTGLSSMNKRELKAKLGNVRQANIAVRHFPMSVDDLRKRLKLQDGGSLYIFATTIQGRHCLLLTEKQKTL